MFYGTYNIELGYSNGPEYQNAFDAIVSASGKCRKHTVQVYDDYGHYIKDMDAEEQRRIYDEESAKFPADKISIYFPEYERLDGESGFDMWGRFCDDVLTHLRKRASKLTTRETDYMFAAHNIGMNSYSVTFPLSAFSTTAIIKIQVWCRLHGAVCVQHLNRFHKCVFSQDWSNLSPDALQEALWVAEKAKTMAR